MRSLCRQMFTPILAVAALLAGVPQSAAGAPPPRATYLAYFYKPDDAATPLGAYLVPVAFPLPEGTNWPERMRLAFQTLCAKPPRGLTSAMKPGCKVGSARVEQDSTLVVNFTEGEVFQPSGTTGDAMVVEQIAMTAAQFGSVGKVAVAFQGQVPRDLGSHGAGNPFGASGRSRMFLVTPPVPHGQRPETDSLRPTSAAVRNATEALSRPMLGIINRRLSEQGRTEYLAKQVVHIVPSGDNSLWVTVADHPGLYHIWWAGSEWQVHP